MASYFQASVSIAVILASMAMAQNARAQIRESVRPDNTEFHDLTLVRQNCIPFTEINPADLRDCRVSDFGEFGSVEGQRYFYALYCLVPNDAPDKGQCNDGSFNARYHQQRGLVIFEGDSSGRRVRIIFERVTGDIGTVRYDKPAIIHMAAGILLYIPVAVDGTGAYNESEYYLRVNRKWEQVEAQKWTDELKQRIPPGLEIWKGIWPNLQTMEAVAGLYRSSDANCCPTGGTARIKLAIRSPRFVIESVVIEPPQ
jgi:hypothetical protein